MKKELLVNLVLYIPELLVVFVVSMFVCFSHKRLFHLRLDCGHISNERSYLKVRHLFEGGAY